MHDAAVAEGQSRGSSGGNIRRPLTESQAASIPSKPNGCVFACSHLLRSLLPLLSALAIEITRRRQQISEPLSRYIFYHVIIKLSPCETTCHFSPDPRLAPAAGASLLPYLARGARGPPCT